ncbi:MAG: M24 family metallopeptidase [Planctomycetes bacterium]|nr:M24 family metallopeptidase [Planctomycetota bacterium]
MNTIPERLAALRQRMRALGLTHYLVPSGDESLGEYLPPWRQRRQWASGFTGSAGDLLVAIAEGETWLFADGRYHLQAEEELHGSGIGLQKVGAKDALSLAQMLRALAERHGARCAIGFDPLVQQAEAAAALEKDSAARGARLVPIQPNLIDELWQERPAPPATPLRACPLSWTGASMGDKLAALRAALEKQGADAIALVRLDQICWLTNLRASDEIPFTPFFESCLYADRTSVHLFLHSPEQRLPAGFGQDVPGFQAHARPEFLPFLEGLAERRVLIDPERTTAGVLAAAQKGRNVAIVSGESPVETAKAIKNDSELACLRRANLLASAAATRALLWLEEELAAGRKVSERSFKERLEALFAESPGWSGLAFATIAASGEHGAIVHYSGAGDTPLADGRLFLIDAGIHAGGGTTDATRTVAVGQASAEQRRRYTLVLKSHLRAARQVFPEGTPGSALDALARSALWAERMNYDHGTGHGIGAFLSVHEGPFSLAERRRKPGAGHGLRAGMVTTIEPGHYLAGQDGIRIENVYAIRPSGQDSDDGVTWLCFEPLTWIPLDRRLIDAALLEEAERSWIRWYHGQCGEVLGPLLSEAERKALRVLLG